MDELATLLGHERRLLEFLLFRLIEGKHLLAADEARFLAYAATEVEQAAERVQEAELRRSLLVARLAPELGVSEQVLTLGALARDSIEPYRTIFADHRRAILEFVTEIEEVTRQNRWLAARGARDVAQLLSMVTREPEVLLNGHASRPDPGPTRIRGPQ